MATELDHDIIKQKIVAILQANTALYTTTGEPNELRSIEVGFPQGDSLTDKMPPYAFVTNNSGPFETIRLRTAISSNAVTMLEHTFHYNITVVVNEKDSRTAEVELDDYQKRIMQTLEDDYDLTGGTTSAVDSSFPSRVDALRVPRSDEGKGYKGRIITLTCMKVTN